VATIATLAAAAGAASGISDQPALRGSKVGPKRAFFESAKGVRISFRLTAPGPTDATVRIRRGGRVVRRWVVRAAEPEAVQRIRWNGVSGSRKGAPDGVYRVFVRPRGGAPALAGKFALHGHFFPVRGRHGSRGYIGTFGAPRSGGRVHEGFDIVAACGTPLAAVRAGKVIRRGYDPVLYGNFVEIKGAKERRSYFYAHLPKPAAPKRGERVRTGERIGRVGETGNARYVGCHLHFEIHKHGHPIDPEPDLRAWDRWS
jgi:murein DD-endopeptidase MepM/ murein hydrolase activator NlpD